MKCWKNLTMKTIMYLSALGCLPRKECYLIYVNIFICDWCPNMGPDYTQGGESNFLAKVCAARRDIISPISCSPPPRPSINSSPLHISVGPFICSLLKLLPIALWRLFVGFVWMDSESLLTRMSTK